jgi:four helix bundle protein
MATIRQFEDIQAWQEARQLTKAIYRVTDSSSFNKDYVLRRQIRRAAISIMSNVAEGFGRGGNKEFAHFLSIAIGSTFELQAQLYVASDQHYISQDEFDTLYAQAAQISRQLGGLIQYLKKSNQKGPKFLPSA